MLKWRSAFRPLTWKTVFGFSAQADPYYILGVEKATPFP